MGRRKRPLGNRRLFHAPTDIIREMFRNMTPTNMRRLGLAYSFLGVGVLAFGRGVMVEGSPLAWRGWFFLVSGIAIALFPKVFKWMG